VTGKHRALSGFGAFVPAVSVSLLTVFSAIGLTVKHGPCCYPQLPPPPAAA
jgi:hypothetical protein